MARPSDPLGFTLIELCLLLVLFALLSALAVPSFSRTIAQTRTRAVLARLSGELFLARSLAARDGRPLRVRFNPAVGCAGDYAIVTDEGVVLRTVRLRSDFVCLSSNVEWAMRVNARGMLVGSARTFVARSGSVTDSAVVSIIGRVHRW